MKSTTSTCHLRKFRNLVAIPQSTGTKAKKEEQKEPCSQPPGLHIRVKQGIPASASREFEILKKIAFPFTVPPLSEQPAFRDIITVDGDGHVRVKVFSDFLVAAAVANLKIGENGQVRYSDSLIVPMKYTASATSESDLGGGYKLLRNLARSVKRYQFRVSNTLEGIDRRIGEHIVYEIDVPSLNLFGPDINFSTTPRGDYSDKPDQRAGQIIHERWHLANALPLECWDGTIAIVENNRCYKDYCPPPVFDPLSQTKLERALAEEQKMKARLKSYAAMTFHALAENYYRTEPEENGGGKKFSEVHELAKHDEEKLPFGHPARSLCPGQGTTICKTKPKPEDVLQHLYQQNNNRVNRFI